jgi:hypothetical protein
MFAHSIPTPVAVFTVFSHFPVALRQRTLGYILYPGVNPVVAVTAGTRLDRLRVQLAELHA